MRRKIHRVLEWAKSHGFVDVNYAGDILNSSSTVSADMRRLRSNKNKGLLRQAKLGEGESHVDG